MIVLKRIGRWLDKTWRTQRPAILPSFRRAYRQLKQQAVPLPPPTQPLALFDFHNNRIDGPQGRRFFNLAMMCLKAGYHPVFTDHALFLANPRDNFKAKIFARPFSIIKRPEDLNTETYQCLVFTDHGATQLHFARNSVPAVEISLAVGPVDASREFAWPFPMFPGLYDADLDAAITNLQHSERRWTFFFGGRSAGKSYDKGWVDTVYNKVPRNRYLAIAKRTFSDLKVPLLEPITTESWAPPSAPNALFIHNEQCKLPQGDWLPTMAQARFFLACPGVRYPMSHNAVEALAVGSVPVLEYPEDFFPSLEHGKNCLVFEGESGLAHTLRLAAEMSEKEWVLLSQGAVAYYNQNLSPQAAIKRVRESALEGQTVLRLVPYLKEGGGMV